MASALRDFDVSWADASLIHQLKMPSVPDPRGVISGLISVSFTLKCCALGLGEHQFQNYATRFARAGGWGALHSGVTFSPWVTAVPRGLRSSADVGPEQKREGKRYLGTCRPLF